GAGIGVVTIDTTNTAEITALSTNTIGGASALVAATTNHNLVGAGLAGSAGGVAASAAVAVFDDTSTTSALLSGATVNVAGMLGVDATDDTELTLVAGAVGVGGSVAASAGGAVGVLHKDTTAKILGTADVTAGDVIVDADSGEAILATTMGLGVGGIAGGAGALGVLDVADTTTAEIGTGVSVLAQGNVGVLASDTMASSIMDGGAAVSGVALGASIGIGIISATTHATIDDGASVTALGKNAALAYIASYAASFGSYSDNFKAPGISQAGITGSAGNVGDPTSSAEAEEVGLALLTEARTSSSQTLSAKGVIVNAATSNTVRELDVGGAAASDLYNMGLAGSLAGGGLAAGGAGTSIAIVSNKTIAQVANAAKLTAADDINVTA